MLLQVVVLVVVFLLVLVDKLCRFVAFALRTTTLNEELGQIEYIFSDKVRTVFFYGNLGTGASRSKAGAGCHAFRYDEASRLTLKRMGCDKMGSACAC